MNITCQVKLICFVGLFDFRLRLRKIKLLNPKVNVCVVNPDYYRSSGVTIAIKRIYQTVCDREINCYFVDCGIRKDLQDTNWIPEENLVVFHLMSLNPIKLFVELLRFSRWARQQKIHVFHVHHRRLAILFRVFYFLFNGPVLYSANLTYKFNLFFWLFCPKNIIAITQSVKENVINTTRAVNIDVIGNPTEFSIDSPINQIKADLNTAICVARLDPVKGHHFLIEAWHLLIMKGLNYRLILVGEGVLKEQLLSQVKELGLDFNVKFYGYSANVNLLYEQSLFSILVSEVEGQGIVTIESAAVGRATLLTDVDGSRDCLPPNKELPNGLVFGDVDSLATALEYWFAHPTEVLKEGKIFFDFHKEVNSFDAVGEKYINVYRRLFNEKKDLL
jgi:glycosyltransferase involved in cell wall biosynthesis